MENRPEVTASETPDELITHIAHLMDEAQAMLAGPYVAQDAARRSALQARLRSVEVRLAALYGKARQRIVAGAEVADETIRSHPYQAIVIALGVGVLVGALWRRSDD